MNKIQTLLTTTVLLFGISGSSFADFDDGYDAYQKGDYKTAFNEWKSLAKQDHVYAQLNLGMAYRDGLGVEKNAKEAFKWYEKAASRGSDDGLHHLGNSYAYVKGVMKNKALAMKLYKEAADNGHAASMYSMGGMHYTNKDYKKAAEWFKRAYERGDLYKKFTGLRDSLKMVFFG